jgi:hypothetical protein
METEKNKPEAAGTETGVMEGTKEMGYWQFRKDICTKEGWQLRRIDPQTYEVINSKHDKIGMFKSGEGYLPNLESVNDSETPPESA